MTDAFIGALFIVYGTIAYVILTAGVFASLEKMWEWLESKTSTWFVSILIFGWPIWLIPSLYAAYRITNITGNFILGLGQ